LEGFLIIFGISNPFTIHEEGVGVRESGPEGQAGPTDPFDPVGTVDLLVPLPFPPTPPAPGKLPNIRFTSLRAIVKFIFKPGCLKEHL
jgi:hypothetical protein